MSLVASALRRPLTVVVVIGGVMVGALLAWRAMPRDIFPTLGIPTLYVAQPYGGLDPAQMEGYLTYYYEYHFLYLTGIEHVESKSIQGAALIKLQFYAGTDMAQAMAETVAYVNRARAFMPPGTVPPFIMRFDAGSVPVGDLVFSSDTRTVGEMQDLALNRVRPLFATLPGVSAPPPFGGSARSIVINLEPERLRACRISPEEVVQAIADANLISPSGNLPMGGQYPMVPLNAVARDIQDLEGVPIRAGVFPAVFLRDVGQVTDGSDVVTSYALVNGHRTVYIPVTKRSSASTLSVVKLVKASLGRFQSVLPADVKVSYEFDQSPYVTRAIGGLILEGALGAGLTGLMVLMFLRDWRSAAIVVANIPLALAGGILGLWLTRQTINIMTLGGLALAVGILVDEATVCVENIHTHLTRGESLARAARDASTETAGPRLLAMLCILAMFSPTLFMVGAARAMFLPLSLAVGFSMVSSYLLSSTLVPILVNWVGRGHAGGLAGGGAGRVFEWLQRHYARLGEGLVRRAWLGSVVYLLAGGTAVVMAGRQLGTEIYPRVESGQIQLRFRAPAGTRIERSEAMALEVLEVIKAEVGAENVALSLCFVGVHGASYPINLIYLFTGGPQEGVMQVQLKAGRLRRLEDLQERLRRELARRLPELAISFEPGDIVSRVMSLGSATPIEVTISGVNLGADREFAERVRGKLEKIPSLRDVQYGQALEYPTVEVEVDRQRAGLLGVKMAAVARSLVPATSSSRFTVPNYWADPNSGVAYQVQVQVPQGSMGSLESARNVPVMDGHGKPVLLRNFARVKEGSAVGEYDRYNMQRMVTVTANVAGADLGRVAREVGVGLGELGAPPPGVTVTVRGQVIPLGQMLEGLRVGVGLAVLVIFLLLAAHFQSVKLSLVVVSTVPAVLAGAVLLLWVTRTTLNLESFMGGIMALGVAVANAILLVTFAEGQRRAGAAAGLAAVRAAQTRLRPILMTSLAMMAGMLPMALGVGEGGEQTAPLARAVIGGLGGGTVATLWVLPSVFGLVQARAHRRSPSLDPDDPAVRGGLGAPPPMPS
jgi:multidrug efflux pump subunit AcrB